jgi:quinol monooxygenase YgiN
MSVVAVWSWASEPEDVEAVRAALSELVVHCEAEHPLIQRLEWLEASENSGGPVEFRWIEEYESREAMESDEYTDVCEGLWQPVKDRAIADTFGGKAYDRGGGILR